MLLQWSTSAGLRNPHPNRDAEGSTRDTPPVSCCEKRSVYSDGFFPSRPLSVNFLLVATGLSGRSSKRLRSSLRQVLYGGFNPVELKFEYDSRSVDDGTA